MAAMHAHIVMTSDDTLLSALRRTLQDAEESLLCVAFVSMEGVHLIERELKNTTASLLATTVFGSTKPAALNRVLELGSSVRTLNPSPGTYHPKVYLGRRGDRLSALIGSSNLTGGLVVNVEAATWIEGRVTDPQLSRLWGWARGLWENPRAEQWQPKTLSADEQPVITGELHRLLELEAERDPVFLTLGRSSRPNLTVAPIMTCLDQAPIMTGLHRAPIMTGLHRGAHHDRT